MFAINVRPGGDRARLPLAGPKHQPANVPPNDSGRVEEGRGGVAYSELRLPSPLIKPDVPISGIRLSD